MSHPHSCRRSKQHKARHYYSEPLCKNGCNTPPHNNTKTSKTYTCTLSKIDHHCRHHTKWHRGEGVTDFHESGTKAYVCSHTTLVLHATFRASIVSDILVAETNVFFFFFAEANVNDCACTTHGGFMSFHFYHSLANLQLRTHVGCHFRRHSHWQHQLHLKASKWACQHLSKCKWCKAQPQKPEGALHVPQTKTQSNINSMPWPSIEQYDVQERTHVNNNCTKTAKDVLVASGRNADGWAYNGLIILRTCPACVVLNENNRIQITGVTSISPIHQLPWRTWDYESIHLVWLGWREISVNLILFAGCVMIRN